MFAAAPGIQDLDLVGKFENKKDYSEDSFLRMVIDDLIISAFCPALSAAFFNTSSLSKIIKGTPSDTRLLIDFPVSSLIILSNSYSSSGTSMVTLLETNFFIRTAPQNEKENYYSDATYFLTASRKINDLDRSSFSAMASIFCKSSSSISKQAFTFMISILSLLILNYLLFLLLILNILFYNILLESIRKLYILLDS